MHVLSAAEMQACDRSTTQRFGIASIDLMRAASSAVAAFARKQFRTRSASPCSQEPATTAATV